MDAWWTGRHRSPDTEFQNGNLPPSAVSTGTESDATKGGYIKIKIAEPNVWRLRSHLVWESAHGRPLPNGWIVRHLDGDPKNDDPENLRAMARSRHLARTLEDPDVMAKKQRRAAKATRARWQRYRADQLERELSEYDSYYWK